MPALTPTQRSTQLLRSEGWLVARVEYWNSFAKKRVDLLGFGDLLAVHPRDRLIAIVQVTTRSNVAARRRKILSLEAHRLWCAAGGVIEIHGWAPNKRLPKWDCRRIRIEKGVDNADG